jgi:2-polyprenyl-3-methyl-5-hydroxy-6-metoxy-1,4-benzoquinol methylase
MELDGFLTPGYFDWRSYLDAFPLKDIRGKSVLDVGSGDGYFSFVMEKMGATVTALDIPTASQTDNLKVIKKLAKRKSQGHRDPFNIAKKIYHSKIKKINQNIYDISPKKTGMYDIVFCNDVLLHLSDPVKAIRNFKTIAKEAVIVGTPVINPPSNPIIKYFESRMLGLSRRDYAVYTGQTGNGAFWMPTVECLENWLKTVGLIVESSQVLTIKPSDMICSIPRGIVRGSI